MPKSTLITGGTGLLGSELITLLKEKGHTLRLLSRSKGEHNGVPAFEWDYKNDFLEEGALDGIDTIVHLAGAGVADKKWSEARKEEILNSRTQTSHLLYNKLQQGNHSVKTLVAASAIGYYGMDSGNAIMKENSAVGHDFLAHVVDAWESSTKTFEQLGIRVVQIRIGVVLSEKGGALPQLLKPPVAAPLASGDQYMSWIHIADLASILAKSIETENMAGVYNGVAPNPMTNREFTKQAAKAFGKTYVPIAVPKVVLKVMLGEMGNVVIGGNRVSSEKIMQTGYSFEFPKLEQALNDLAEKR